MGKTWSDTNVTVSFFMFFFVFSGFFFHADDVYDVLLFNKVLSWNPDLLCLFSYTPAALHTLTSASLMRLTKTAFVLPAVHMIYSPPAIPLHKTGSKFTRDIKKLNAQQHNSTACRWPFGFLSEGGGSTLHLSVPLQSITNIFPSLQVETLRWCLCSATVSSKCDIKLSLVWKHESREQSAVISEKQRKQTLRTGSGVQQSSFCVSSAGMQISHTHTPIECHQGRFGV